MAINIGGNLLSSTGFNSSSEILNTPNIITDGITLWIDAGNLACYTNTNSYYDCGYGCQYYASDPGCSNCNTQLKDMSGNGNDGTLQSATVVYDSTGGNANFNGSSQYVSCGNFGNFFNQGTISYWLNAASMSNYNNSFSTHYLGSNAGIRFEENASGTFGVVVGNDALTYSAHQYIASGMAINTWYHMTLTWNVTGNNVIGYLNGSQVFNESQTYWATTMPSISIGSGFSADRYWNGKIGPFMMYNRVLSSTENLQNFNNGRQRFGI